MKQLPTENGLEAITPTTSTRESSNRSRDTVAKHIHPRCECRVIPAPGNAIERIRKNGGVPILNIETTDTDKLGISAKQWDERTKFVVLHHALPEGFGSSSSRTIATCQLIRIADRMGKLQVDEVRAELCFWMDTLCTPEQDEPELSAAYQNAYAVLCFDTRPLPVPSGSSARDPQFAAYVGSLFQDHPSLGMNRRLLLVTNQGTIDMAAGAVEGTELPRSSKSYMPNLSKGDLDWRPVHERTERRAATVLREHMQFSVLRR